MIEAIEAHRKLIDDVKGRVEPVIAEKAHLQRFCTDACCLRYLRARGMDVTKASRLLIGTLEWRDAEDVDSLRFSDLGEQARTGKVMRALCTDKEGRPVLVLRPRHENKTKDQAGNLRNFVYHIEMAARCAFLIHALQLPKRLMYNTVYAAVAWQQCEFTMNRYCHWTPAQAPWYADRNSPDGKMVVLIDYTAFTIKNAPPLSTSTAILNIVQNHYPERLHEALLWHPPYLFLMTWKALSPFVDHVTKKKLCFLMANDTACVDALAERLDVRQLDKSCGGLKEDAFELAHAQKVYEEEEALYFKGEVLSDGSQ